MATTSTTDRRVLRHRRAKIAPHAKGFSDSVRATLQGTVREVDLIQAEKLAATVEHMAGEPLHTARRREIVATLRLLITATRAGLK
jgi:hypothetical protein